jgi:hypothetical protein
MLCQERALSAPIEAWLDEPGRKARGAWLQGVTEQYGHRQVASRPGPVMSRRPHDSRSRARKRGAFKPPYWVYRLQPAFLSL